jgi:3-hydroxyisobutyrate dehydrogenase-like beta-hydroxyacid dehydrogenase
VITVGIVSLGEMGAAVARRLTAAGDRVVTCDRGRSSRTIETAGHVGAEVAPDLSVVARESAVVLSVVPQDAALEVARDFAGASVDDGVRPLYIDANSLSPATMGEIAGVLASAGWDCVDGAFVGNAAALGEKTTLYLSGSRAGEAARLLARALTVRVLGGEVGAASAFKLSIYGFNKGLVALFLEMMAAADRLGLRGELMDCLRDFYPGSVATVERLLPTYPRHARRRAAEMAEVIAWLGEIGQSADMAQGTRAVIENVASLGLPAEGDSDAETLVAEMCRRGLLRRGEPRPR